MKLDRERRLQLEADYRRTDYVVDDEDVHITIRLDRHDPALDGILTSLKASTWAFLTAYNPYSRSLTDLENAKRQDRLVKLLNKHGYRYQRACGVGDGWEEPSFFIVDITRKAAMDIGRQFEQNAILWGSIEHDPELVWCVEVEFS